MDRDKFKEKPVKKPLIEMNPTEKFERSAKLARLLNGTVTDRNFRAIADFLEKSPLANLIHAAAIIKGLSVAVPKDRLEVLLGARMIIKG